MNERGSLFILTLLIAGLLAMLSGGMLTRSVVEQRASRSSLSLARAFHLSESGVDLAIHELRADPNYTGAGYADFGTGSGGYSIDVIPDGLSSWVIRSTGFYPSNDPTAVDYAARTIETVVRVTKGIGPGYGVLGVQSVRFDGWGHDDIRRGGRSSMKVDSYDSQRGPYTREGADGNLRICTNGYEEKVIALVGGVTINGDIVLGPGSDPDKTLWQVPKQWTSIRGSVSVAELEAPIELVEMPMLPDGGHLSLSGHDVVTLPGGLYRFHDLQISGNGTLLFTGPAAVYVEEDVQISGAGRIDTASHLPTDLALYARGAHVSISGDADLFAKVVAPNATVEISGNGDLYGAITGREIIVRGRGDIHYDEALNLYDEALNPPRRSDPFRVSILSWREASP